MKLILSLFFVIAAGNSIAQSATKESCAIMKTGTFKYLEAFDSSAYFVITDTSHTEYYGNGKYYIKSQMNWTGDCQYTMRMIAVTIPDFPFKPGDIMLVTINKIEGDIVYYTSEVNGMKWQTSVRKLK